MSDPKEPAEEQSVEADQVEEVEQDVSNVEEQTANPDAVLEEESVEHEAEKEVEKE